jgi:hypothetical protein
LELLFDLLGLGVIGEKLEEIIEIIVGIASAAWSLYLNALAYKS